jgi:hypothetical protein
MEMSKLKVINSANRYTSCRYINCMSLIKTLQKSPISLPFHENDLSRYPCCFRNKTTLINQVKEDKKNRYKLKWPTPVQGKYIIFLLIFYVPCNLIIRISFPGGSQKEIMKETKKDDFLQYMIYTNRI